LIYFIDLLIVERAVMVDHGGDTGPGLLPGPGVLTAQGFERPGDDAAAVTPWVRRRNPEDLIGAVFALLGEDGYRR
jgi:hypothetical protein